MSVQVYFEFSTGLECPLWAPVGTKAAIISHVEEIEAALGLKRVKYLDNPVHWDHFDADYRAGFPKVGDETLCKTIGEHNHWVRRLYGDMMTWSKTAADGLEEITPADATEFWHGLTQLTVQPDRWTGDYYRNRMDHLYEVLRGHDSEGVSFDAKGLTPKQAGAVIGLFEQFLDPGDHRLEVPNGHDYLASSGDGGYVWCEKCGPAHPDDVDGCRKRKCPILAERKAEEAA